MRVALLALCAVAIPMLLMADLLPRWSSSVDDGLDRARMVRVHGDLFTLRQACLRFREDTGRLPRSASELIPSYMTQLPMDPWTGATYYWIRSAKTLRIVSLGSDRRVGGCDLNADIKETF